MARNASGTYTLPSGNPVVSGTLIDATWANNTLSDLGNEMTDSLSRSGEGAMLAPLRITDGVQATPSLAFSNEPSSGLYRAGSNEWWAVAAGVQNLRFTNLGLTTRAAAGAVGTPSLAAFNDTDTGIYFPGANELAIATGGAARMTFDAAGGVAVPGTFSVTGTSAFTGAVTLTANPTLSGGTANGVLYLNGSKVATSGATFAFDSSDRLIVGAGSAVFGARIECVANTSGEGLRIRGRASDATGTLSFGANAAATEYARIQSDNTSALIFGTGASGTERMRLTSSVLSTDSSISVGIGTASPTYKLDVNGQVIGLGTNTASSGNGGQLRFRDDTGTFRWLVGMSGAAGTSFLFYDNVASLTRLTIDSSGNLGLGLTPSAWGSPFASGVLEFPAGFIAGSVANNVSRYGMNSYYNGSNYIYKANGYASALLQNSGAFQFFTAPSGTAGNPITGANAFVQTMTLDASGNLGLGTTSPNISGGASGSQVFTVSASASARNALIELKGTRTSADQVSSYIRSFSNSGATPGVDLQFYRGATDTDGFLTISTSGTERGRFTAAGDFLVGQITNALADTGHILDGDGLAYHITNGLTCLTVNRKTSDGTLVDFLQDGTSEGTISVSGNTVSYNAFAGSHWSQLQDGSKPDILRGTVMESINELCEWPDENNERLPKAKISDTAGSKKVYGVFMAWDNDWTQTNDMYVTAVGAFICRVNGSVTVQEGDLLESNGDGTARVQADDIIRSSTIGKVTSTVKTHQYDDGSYCVPTVLYCG